jgi:hypothetical protein
VAESGEGGEAPTRLHAERAGVSAIVSG